MHRPLSENNTALVSVPHLALAFGGAVTGRVDSRRKGNPGSVINNKIPSTHSLPMTAASKKSAQPTNHRQCLIEAATIGDSREVAKHIDVLLKSNLSLAEVAMPAILAAAKAGHISILNAIVKRGCRLIQALPQTASPMHAACESGKPDIVEFVLENGGSAYDVNDNGWTGLHIAANSGFTSVVQFVAEKETRLPIDVKTKDTGDSALALAAKNCHLDTLRALLELNASTENKDFSGATPLFTAAKEGNLEVVKVLLDARASPESPGCGGEQPMVIAAKNGHAEVVHLLLDYEAKPHPHALQAAAQKGFSAVVEELLMCGGITELRDSKGMTPLFLAAQSGHIATIQELLKGGAQPNAATNAGIGPLYIAAKKGHTEIVRALLDAGADFNMRTQSMGLTPLHVASQEGHQSIVEILLAKGCDPCPITTSKETPILLATAAGHEGVVEAFLDRGVNPETSGHRGESILHTASKHGHRAVVGLLLQRGVDTEARKASTGETALLIAAQEGHSDLVQILLDHGALVEASNKIGKTALMLGSERGQEEVVKVLLMYGAEKDDTIRNLSNTTSQSTRRALDLISRCSYDNATHQASKMAARQRFSTQERPQEGNRPESQGNGHVNQGQLQTSTSNQQLHQANGQNYVDHVDSDDVMRGNGNKYNVDTPLPLPSGRSVNGEKGNVPMTGYDLPIKERSNPAPELSGPGPAPAVWKNGVWHVVSPNGRDEGQMVQTSPKSFNDLKSVYESRR